jgi:SNF2 family DNA or RNA helicase
LKILSSDFLPHVSRFESHFVVKQDVEYGRKKGDASHGKKKKTVVSRVVGYKNLDELKALIESVSIRRTKADMVGFPEKITMIRDVVLSGAQLALYRKISEEVLSKLASDGEVDVDTFMGDTTKGLRLRMALNHPSLLDEPGDSAKYLECDALLEEILSNPLAKVIIWTEFRKGVDLLYDRYNDLYGAVKIYGGVDNKQLALIEAAFVRNDGPKVAVCIPAKAGTGVDFLARARTSIYIDRPYSLTLFNQSGDRIHRRVTASENKTELDMIRSQPATLIFLDVVGSIDEGVRDKLASKMDLSMALTTSNDTLMKIGRSDLIRYLSM